MELFGRVCQRPKSILLHLCLGILCMIVCCQVDETKIPDAKRRPSDTIVKCLTCKELIWILSINTDFMVSQDPTLVNASSLTLLLHDACKYPEWTADYEINFDIERSEYHVNLLGKKRASRDTWHDEYLLKGCKFVYKSKANDIATEIMKYIDNKQKVGNYVDSVQDKICEDVCVAATHGQYGRQTHVHSIRTSTESIEIGVQGGTHDSNGEDEEFLEDEIDDWNDTM